MERRKGKKEKEGEDLGRGRRGKGEGREGERGRALILEILEYPYNTVYTKPPCQKPAVFIQSFRYSTGV